MSHFAAHDRCFVCGAQNASGLRLAFEKSRGRARCRARLDERFQSYEGIVHGGILAAIADATMVHLLQRDGGSRPLTCRLDLRYRAPVCVGDEVLAEARVTRAKLGIARAACRLTVEDRVCVEATAAFRVGSLEAD